MIDSFYYDKPGDKLSCLSSGEPCVGVLSDRQNGLTNTKSGRVFGECVNKPITSSNLQISSTVNHYRHTPLRRAVMGKQNE
jgi:hypothetical protein